MKFARVRPADAPGSKRAAVLNAARNEYAPFQIIVRAGTRGLKSVNAVAGPLTPKLGHAIPADRVTLYREHYIQVGKSSPKLKSGPGWYPDALIPFLDPGTGKPPVGGRFRGGAVRYRPGFQPAAYGIDVLTPKDASPGVYTGSITISAEGAGPRRVPIELTIWDFTLPETPSMRTRFGDDKASPLSPLQMTAQGGLDEAGQLALQTAYAELMAAHRICSPIPLFLMPKVNADGSIDPQPTHSALQRWIERFHITGFPIQFLGRDGPGWQADPLGADRQRNVRYLGSMYTYLRAYHWDKMAYIYVADEPSTQEAYNDVRTRSKFVRDVAQGSRCFVQRSLRSGTSNGGPWWARWISGRPSGCLFEQAAVRKRLTAGEEIWSYTALCQGHQDTLFWELDFPLLNYRIPMWISWRLGVTGLLYWSTTNWASAGDVWTNPLTYEDQYNMEGSLLYPGADAGVQGFIPSIRLKEIREGLEDYEYLKILAERRSRAAAADVVKRIAPELARLGLRCQTPAASAGRDRQINFGALSSSCPAVTFRQHGPNAGRISCGWGHLA